MNIFITTLGFLFVFAWLALRSYPKLGLWDRPKKYGLKRKPVPYPGGLAIYFAFLFSFIIFLPVNSSTLSVLIAASILVAVSFIDDRAGLPPIFRLFVQFASAGVLVWGGMGITSITNPFGGSIALDTVGIFSGKIFLYSAVLTIVWVVVMVNAYNWIDGVPGMASSIAFVSFLILFLLSIRPDFHYLDQTLAISFALIGMALSLGFLVFDFPPPRMIMGDTGSMLLGFLLAVTAIISGGKIATTVLVLGFPILDFMWVIARRIYKKQSPFKGDLMHFHHRLLKAGFSEGKVVVFYAAAGIVFGSLALMLHTEGKLIAFVGILALMAVFGIVLYRK
ncbi:undecaprenyl/decaprenyl-phosphate alpha-N-acetylglucosaminyl 1-phosphate transferase [Candidatus Peregrinibacteria bacterium]|nr:undecaprenyl/decaprenyl-phosphate alpha-N-acetylglucosaminyl 1-phosphate transferase [Candidatus Peregrinibacteria bacterium]